MPNIKAYPQRIMRRLEGGLPDFDDAALWAARRARVLWTCNFMSAIMSSEDTGNYVPE